MVITRRTRNAFARKGTGVRIPSSPVIWAISERDIEKKAGKINGFTGFLLNKKLAEHSREEESKMNATVNVQRPCSISESIKQSCQEVKLMREGKIPKRS